MNRLYRTKVYSFFIVLFSVVLNSTIAQSIQGEPTVFEGYGGYYTYNDGLQHTGMIWSATNGEVQITEENGTEYRAYVFFSSAGTGTIDLHDETFDITKSFSVTVIGCPKDVTFTGGGVICGSAPLSAYVYESESGTAYQLINANGSNIGASQQGSGGTLTWSNLSPETYKVKASRGACTKVMDGVVSVTQGVVPTVFSVSGGGSYCKESQSPNVILNGIQQDVTYQLCIYGVTCVGAGQNDGQGHIVWSNYGDTGSGTATVVATHSTGCSISMQGPTITQMALPADKAVTGGSPYCSPGENGSSVSVNADQNVTYNLFRNNTDIGSPQTATSNGQTIIWLNQPTGTYSISATSSQGCTRQISQSAVISSVQGSVGGSFNPASADVYAGNNSGVVRLTDGSYIGTVQSWAQDGVPINEDINGINYSDLQQTAHFVAYVKNGSCPVAQSDVFTVNVYPVPVITGNNVLYEGSSTQLSVQNIYSQYQWYYNGTLLSGATSYQLNATNTGSYSVYVRATLQAEQKSSLSFEVITPLQAQSNLNYHKVTTLRQPTQSLPLYNDIQGLPLTAFSRQIEYMDGLGRTLQQIALAQTPSQKDLIVPVQYDAQGKTKTDYLPYSDGAYVGTYRSLALSGSAGDYSSSDQYKFYANNATTIAHSTAPYSISVYDNSPLDQVIEQGAPGTEWQPGSGHTVRSSVLVSSQDGSAANAVRDIRQWTTAGPTGSMYPTSELLVSQLTDENGNNTWSFTDKQGHTILKRVQLDENLKLDENDVATPFLETYYVYDNRGNLALQIPPKAVAKLNNGTAWSAAFRDEWCYVYTYDERNRLVEKKTPDAATVYYTYDPLNRLVLTQDGNLHGQNKWLFIKYDAAGRPVMQGLYQNTTYTDRATLQQQVMDGLYVSAPHYEIRGNALHGYSNQSFPQTNADGSVLELLSVSYYDHYDFDYNGTDDFAYTSQNLDGEGQQATAFGLPTGSKRVILGSNTWLYTYQFYDQQGKVIQSRSNNHLSATIDNLSTAVYDFEGKTLLTKTYHNAGGSNQTTVVNTYAYDASGRLLSVTQKNNNEATVTLAAYVYNELGQVIKKNLYARSDAREGQPGFELGDDITKSVYNNESELAARNSITFEPGFTVSEGKSLSAGITTSDQENIPEGQRYMQSVDYRYNIRGWLSSINNAQLTNDGSVNDDADGYTGDYFGMELLYNTSEAGLNNTQFYNGNISATKWKSMTGSGAEDQRSYKYTYDKSDRLKGATFQAHNGIAWLGEVGTLNETQTYDHNGNILTLQRNRVERGPLTAIPLTMDNLTYTYASGKGNKLGRVEDSASEDGFSNLSVNGDVEYDYTTDGALIRDDNKGISAITNNVLGKPQQITYSDGRTVAYTYDAAGSKLTMVVTKEGATTTTHYVNGFVYEGNALSFFSSPEGRVVKSGSNLEDQFAMTDHQGNTRVVFGTKTPGEQTVTATFEAAVQEREADDFPDSYPSGAAINPVATNNHTTGGSKSLLLNGGYAGMVGMARSYKVYPGDKIKMEAYARYEAPTGNSSNLTGIATALLNAFALPVPAAGEAGTAARAINDWGSIAAGGFADGTTDEDHTKAFVNILVFDKNYQLLDMAFAQVTSDGAPALVSKSYDIKEVGYVYLYLSNENQTQTNVYFDDVTISYTPTNIIQYNEYYPFGLQTASSWTRENTTGNNYLGNSGTEFNAISNLYDLDFRNYDPILGRMNQVDPMTDKYASLSPYNFSFNDPVYFSDPGGAEPCMFCPGGSAYGGPTLERNDGGGSSGVMMNGQPMYGRDPFGNQYWSGGAVGYDIYQNAAYLGADGISIDGRGLSTNKGQVGYWTDTPLEGEIGVRTTFTNYNAVILNFTTNFDRAKAEKNGWKVIDAINLASAYAAAAEYVASGHEISALVVHSHGDPGGRQLHLRGSMLDASYYSWKKLNPTVYLMNKVLSLVASGGKVAFIGCNAGKVLGPAMSSNIRSDIDAYMNLDESHGGPKSTKEINQITSFLYDDPLIGGKNPNWLHIQSGKDGYVVIINSNGTITVK